MRTVAVSELITKIRVRADVEKTNFVTDPDIVGYINSLYCELYDLIVSKYENYFVSSHSFNAVSSTNLYDVPEDFYKLLKVERLVSGTSASDASARWAPIFPINFQETGSRQSAYWPVLNRVKYILQNDQIRLDPPDSFVCRIWYIPAPEVITDESEINGRAGWEEYIIAGGAALCKKKQDLDASQHERDKAAQVTRILRMAQNYDAGLPKTIVDVDAMCADPLFYR